MEIFLDTDVDKFFEIKEPVRVKNIPYWTAEVYGFGKYIREFAGYPLQFPLYINTDHGVASTGVIYDNEINSDAPIQFYHSPETVDQWRAKYKRPCFVLYSPFVFYRRKYKIDQLPSAQGTLVFPGHTTPEIDDISDIEKYIDDLEALPEKYKPLSICMHYHDINKGMHRIFLNKGYRVFSAGHPFDYNFIPNFYNILRNYKFSTSNLYMSCLFYSIEMGIPHFIYGNVPVLINNGDSNLAPGKYEVMEIPRIKMITEMFQGPFDTITTDQMALVINDLGLTRSISRTKMAFMLYKSLFTSKLRGNARQARIRLSRNYNMIKKSVPFSSYLLKRSLRQTNREEEILVKKGYVRQRDIFKLKYAKDTSSILLGKIIGITDPFWHLHSLKEIFAEEVYRFRSDTEIPYILDCGANIGLSAIYFKRLFPKSRIIAFEPDTNINSLLRNNLQAFEYSDVHVENKAIWTEATVLNFSGTGNLGGSIGESLEEIPGPHENVTQVSTVRLRDYLSDQVDFLKIDIEGAEAAVLSDCADLLKNVKNLFVEYHSLPGKEQKLDQILRILKEAGFTIYIKEAYNNLPLPFLHKDYNPWYNLQLNIFGYRVT